MPLRVLHIPVVYCVTPYLAVVPVVEFSVLAVIAVVYAAYSTPFPPTIKGIPVTYAFASVAIAGRALTHKGS
jgi:hypothetical protein